jgi:gliding motility-associated-like protein
MTIHPSPSIAPGQVFKLSAGKGITLDPVVTGEIATYAWSPAAGLSDSTIRNPVANPSKTTLYTLRVVSADGCEAAGTITVKIFTGLAIPGAFTPNGDGRNDVFYVLGSPPGTLIGDFSIFNRWGEKIFQIHDVPTGDPAFGWNGRFKGQPVPPGTYAYVLTLKVSNAPPQVYKGTVILVR